MTPPLQATSAPTWLDRGKIPSLDGLRGIAVLLVLIAHAHNTTGFPVVSGQIHAVLGWGRIGVDLFFVISGFLITTLMLREFERSGSVSISLFYSRRFLRIVPAYAMFLLSVAVLQMSGLAMLTNADWISALTYTVNFHYPHSREIGHVWSLSVEEHFYLIWPILLVFCKPSAIPAITIGAVAGCFTLRTVLLLGGGPISFKFRYCTFTRLDTIAIGCLLASLAWRPVWRAQLDRFCRNWWALLVLTSSLLVVQLMSLLSYRLRMTVVFPMRAVVLSLLLWTVINRKTGLVNRLLNNRLLMKLGILSYSLYLWQQLFLYPHATGWLRMFPLNIGGACLAAIVSYQFIETPFLRLKQRYSSSAKSHEPRLQMEQMARETPN